MCKWGLGSRQDFNGGRPCVSTLSLSYNTTQNILLKPELQLVSPSTSVFHAHSEYASKIHFVPCLCQNASKSHFWMPRLRRFGVLIIWKISLQSSSYCTMLKIPFFPLKKSLFIKATWPSWHPMQLLCLGYRKNKIQTCSLNEAVLIAVHSIPFLYTSAEKTFQVCSAVEFLMLILDIYLLSRNKSISQN